MGPTHNSTNYGIYISAENDSDFPQDLSERLCLLRNEVTFVFRLIQTQLTDDPVAASSDAQNDNVVLQREKTLELTKKFNSLVTPGEALERHVSTMLSSLEHDDDDDDDDDPTTANLSLPLNRETRQLYWNDIRDSSSQPIPIVFEAAVSMIADLTRDAVVRTSREYGWPYVHMLVTVEKRMGVTTKLEQEPRDDSSRVTRARVSHNELRLAILSLAQEAEALASELQLMFERQLRAYLMRRIEALERSIASTERLLQVVRSLPASQTAVSSAPAAKWAVESLERVESYWEGELVCVICLEKALVGVTEEIFRLPCSHEFHGHCILEWFNDKHTCPVCRFKLPTDSDLDN